MSTKQELGGIGLTIVIMCSIVALCGYVMDLQKTYTCREAVRVLQVTKQAEARAIVIDAVCKGYAQ